MGHGRAIKDLASILQIGDLLLGKSVSQDVFGQRFLPVPIISGYTITGMHAESTAMVSEA